MTTPHTSLSAVQTSVSNLLDLRIKHTRIAQVMTELETLIYPGSQDSILLVCGPTGVGKSTLARHMVEDALRLAADDMNADAGLIPAVYVEAPASGEREFSWRLFFGSILEQLEGDLAIPKSVFGIDSESGQMVRGRKSRNTLASMRMAVERALRARGTRFLVIDEAAHIIRQTRRSDLQVQLDTLKSLANKCGTQMVLVGSYDLYRLMSLSGQLARRTHVLHFERYRQDHQTDLNAFRACLLKFQEQLPGIWGTDLMQYADALHENTHGCIGTLSAVLARAAKLALADGWSSDTLQRALLTDAQRLQILDEILDGETAINPGLTRTLPSLQAKHRSSRAVA